MQSPLYLRFFARLIPSSSPPRCLSLPDSVVIPGSIRPTLSLALRGVTTRRRYVAAQRITHTHTLAQLCINTITPNTCMHIYRIRDVGREGHEHTHSIFLHSHTACSLTHTYAGTGLGHTERQQAMWQGHNSMITHTQATCL